ncbi:MFS transporter [Acidisphaera sp. S103]|uniref:MFS transporter n=1 Tax=Acidisphaera sp. S103 TaxID=1747223 RepID=UPI00131DD7E1|nr:MFS transporter [Acidisphaera sp. S103]
MARHAGCSVLKHPIIPLLIVGLGTLVVPLDSAVNIGFPAIVAHFGLPIPMIQWIVISYTLTQTSLMLSFGRVGDLLGYRRVFLFGTGVSSLAFVGCALAPSYGVLLAARVAQGVGAGLILSCGPALAISLFPEEQRTQVLARYMMMFGIGSALGPSVFGTLVEHFGWSAVFSFRAPIAAVAFLLAWTLPRPARGEREPFDAVGGALLALALSFMLLALNRLRPPGPETVVFAVVAIVGFVLFYRQEHRAAKPIIDFKTFRSADFAVINLSNVLLNLSAFSIMLLAPFYLARIPGLTLPMAGLVLAASPAGLIVAAPIAGRLAVGQKPRVIALVGTALSGVGLFGISLSGSTPDIPILVMSMLVQGFGIGLFQVAYFDIVTATIPARNRGVAGALGMATRTIGTVTGATVLMLIFQSLRASSPDGFMVAFQTTFRIAAMIPAALILLDLRRPRVRVAGVRVTPKE